MLLRAHHLLCIRNYIGKGYSPEFTENMNLIVAALRDGGSFRLAHGRDEVCAACPYMHGDICESEQKSSRYDARVLELLELNEGGEYRYSDIEKLIQKRIIDSGEFNSICSDCNWAQLCHKTR